MSAADLLEVFRLAQTKDAGYAAARAAWEASREKLPQGRALLLPSASVSASTQYNDRTIDFRGGGSSVDKFNSNSISASITQPLYRPQNLVQYEQAKVQMAQADAQVAAALQELIVRVAQAYFDVLLARDNIDLARAQQSAIAEQLALAKKNYDLGIATITDVHEAQARHDLVSAQAIAARNELASRQRVLNQILDAAAPELAPLRAGFSPLAPAPDSMDSWVEQAVRNSLLVQAQEAATQFAEKEVERNRAGHYPSVDAFASHTRAGTGSGVQGGVGFDSVTTALGLQLALPIFQGGAISSRVRESAALLTKAKDELDAARRGAALNASQAFLGVSNGVAQVLALRSAVDSSQKQFESTRLGREVGVRTAVDVLNSQQQMYSARRDLAQATYAYILNDLRLKQAAGTLAESDVARVNGWLGPLAAAPAGPQTAAGPLAVVSTAPEPRDVRTSERALFADTARGVASAAPRPDAQPLGLRLARNLSEGCGPRSGAQNGCDARAAGERAESLTAGPGTLGALYLKPAAGALTGLDLARAGR